MAAPELAVPVIAGSEIDASPAAPGVSCATPPAPPRTRGAAANGGRSGRAASGRSCATGTTPCCPGAGASGSGRRYRSFRPRCHRPPRRASSVLSRRHRSSIPWPRLRPLPPPAAPPVAAPPRAVPPVAPSVAAPTPVMPPPSALRAADRFATAGRAADGRLAEPAPRAPAPQPAVVLPISRSPIRTDAPPPPIPAGVSGLDRLLRMASARGASTLYLSSNARPSVRVDGEIQMLEGEPSHGPNDVESLLLTLVPDRNHEALRSGVATEWISDVDGVGRVRCLSFRDHRGPGRRVPHDARSRGVGRTARPARAKSSRWRSSPADWFSWPARV